MTPTPTAIADFAPMDVAGRISRLRSAFAKHEIDALLVTNLVNVRYLAGFTGSAAHLLITPDEVLFTTDGRYGIQASQQLGAAGVSAEITIGGYAKQKEALKVVVAKSSRLGLEASNVTWAQQRAFDSDWFEANELVPTANAVEELRLVKDQGEIDRLAAAAHIADVALERVLRSLLNNPTESEFALELDFEMRKLGADDVSFDTIVAAGPNGAKAHHEPSDRKIESGELIVIDFGALVDGYHSDMTRTLCVGEPSSEMQAHMVATVAESQAAGVAAVKAGATCADIDTVCRDIIGREGWADAFSHSTGHGVGLDIHEAPAVAGSVTDSLLVNQVVTVEPGVYLADHGGVRIEDTVVVTETGCYPLTKAPKQLVVA